MTVKTSEIKPKMEKNRARWIRRGFFAVLATVSLVAIFELASKCLRIALENAGKRSERASGQLESNENEDRTNFVTDTTFARALKALDDPGERAESIKLLRIEAAKGEPNAQLLMSLLLISDHPDQSAESLQFMKSSANNGNLLAQAFLGSEHMGNEGIYSRKFIPVNIEEGIRLLKLSAEHGCPWAAHALGQHYRAESPAEAKKWYAIAIRHQEVFESGFDPFYVATWSPKNAGENSDESILHYLFAPHKDSEPSLSKKPEAVQRLTKIMQSAVTDSRSALRDMYLDSLPISKKAIGYYLNETSYAMGERPRPNTIFNLLFMQAVQKVDGGYLMRWVPPGEVGEKLFAFLRTDQHLPENAHFLGNADWAIFTGTYQYQAVNGFDQTVLAFAMFDQAANAKLSKRPLSNH